MSSSKQQQGSACPGPGERAVEGECCRCCACRTTPAPRQCGGMLSSAMLPCYTDSNTYSGTYALPLGSLLCHSPRTNTMCAGLLGAVGSAVQAVAECIPGTAEHELRKQLEERGDMSVETGEPLPRPAGETMNKACA